MNVKSSGLRRAAAGLTGAVAALVLVSGVGIGPASAQPTTPETTPPIEQPVDPGTGDETTTPEQPVETQPPATQEPVTPPAPVDPAPVVPQPQPVAPVETTPSPTATPTQAPTDVTTLAVPGAPAPAPGDPNAFVCWGDSLSYHICDPGEGGYLQSALGDGKHVINRAVGGQNSTEIATRMGAYELTVTFSNNQIPASGRVRVEVGNTPNEFWIFNSPVWINGVEGLLSRDRGIFGGWFFERSTPGAATPTPANTPVHMLESSAVNHPGMIWVGRNNVQQPDQIIADVAAMAANHKATSNQPMWIVGMTPSKAETNGTREAGWIKQVNATLKNTYGDMYIPMDDYLRDIAMRDLGLAMTSADQQAVANGVLPPSLTIDDGMHFNADGRRAIAHYIAQVVKDPANDYLRNFDPQGSQAFALDEATGSLQVVGWGFDKSNVYATLQASVAVNGVVVQRPLANWPSPYLAQYGVPGDHAFWTAVPLATGTNEVCVTFHNIGAGADLKLPCATFNLAPTNDGNSPQGDVQMIFDAAAGHVTTVGWAFDHSNLYAQIDVRVTVNGNVAATVRANQPSDYLAAYGVPGAHGFLGGFFLPGGDSRVCVIALDIAPGRDATLGCQNFSVPVYNPEGAARVTMNGDGSISVLGYAFDRSNMNEPINVAVFQNNQLTAIQPANAASPELNPYGVFAPHGINMRVNPITTANSYDVCVLAVNIGHGASEWLGCWTLDSRPVSPLMQFAVETDVSIGMIAVNGWAYDPSVPLAHVPVVVTVDGIVRGDRLADSRRSELGTMFGWPGDHGFIAYVDGVGAGQHTVCVTAYNVGTTAPNTRQCQTVAL